MSTPPFRPTDLPVGVQDCPAWPASELNADFQLSPVRNRRTERDGLPRRVTGRPPIPDYLAGIYAWTYLDRRIACLLDRDPVVATILAGQYRRLREAALVEVEPGQAVLQAAHVYGRLIPELARRLGADGHLDVVDAVPLQVALCRRKLRGIANACVSIADARQVGTRLYDVANCFFLLHELPDRQKSEVVDALLAQIKPGGKVVFVDFHEPVAFHPLRFFYSALFNLCEPYAQSLWHHEISDFASRAGAFRWEKTTIFGGVFQKTIAWG
jgi:ubiquinone/menaquinone biosynthesis C-methylase UbiE